MKNTQGGFIGLILIIIVALGLIGAGTYYFFQSKNNIGTESAPRIYENQKFGYQVELPEGWTLPEQANAYIDLTKKYITDEVQEEIFEEVEQDPGIVVKDQARLDEIENKIKNESQIWNPVSGESILFTNATLQEQNDFYDQVNKKQKLILVDFFPDRTIRINPSNSETNFIATTTSRRISKTITINGVQVNYDKLTGTKIDHMIVSVPFTSDELTYNGEKINSLEIVYLGNKVSESEFLELINSFKFIR